jgi:hypothetical protein
MKAAHGRLARPAALGRVIGIRRRDETRVSATTRH